MARNHPPPPRKFSDSGALRVLPGCYRGRVDDAPAILSQAAVRAIDRVSARLEYVAHLAAIAARNGRHLESAEYILDELRDLSADLASMRAAVHPPPR